MRENIECDHGRMPWEESEAQLEARRHARACWEGNAETWTRLARAGYDVYRDHLNTPAFLRMLPPVGGLCGLDIGCGEGENTRKVAALGARMVGVDAAAAFVRYARDSGGSYCVADGVELPFPGETF